MRLLGVSAFYHDSAAALVEDGEIVAAAQEERFTRVKHDPSFPAQAAAYCLAAGGVTLERVDHVVFYEKPFIKFERLLETYLATAPRGFASFRRAIPLWMREKLFHRTLLERALRTLEPGTDVAAKLLFTDHHRSHAASAFHASPFERAAILTLDGVGEWATTAAGVGHGTRVELHRELHFPHSLGLLYSAFTYHLGFRVNSGESKVMGLAPYGTPRYAERIRAQLVDVKEDGTFHLDQRYFDYLGGLTMTSPSFADLFGARRAPESPLEQRHMDLAASIQQVTEEIVLALTRSLRRETGLPDLCLAGGVALNCVANGRVQRDGAFDRLWVQPAAGDAGGALGAALDAYHRLTPPASPIPRARDRMRGSFLGPEFSQEEIERRLRAQGAVWRTVPLDTLLGDTAEDLAAGRAVGWFQGRMEFGPRALGARSILADPRSPTMQSVLNLKVKHRESFRPFAPSVPRESAQEWFDLDGDSPYMLLVAQVAERVRVMVRPPEAELDGLDRLRVVRSAIPAVTHVDGSARVQTVHVETNPRFHALLRSFHERTGCPVLVNTSFNVRGEPIVCTPEDAYRCFMGTEIERLVIGNALLRKEEQPPGEWSGHARRFVPD